MYLYLHVVRKHMSCLPNFKNFLRLETWENGDKAYCFFVFYSSAVKNFPGSPVGIMSWLNCTKKGSNKVSLIHFTRGVQLYEWCVSFSSLFDPINFTESTARNLLFTSGNLKIQKIYVPSVFKTPIPFSPFYPRWMTMDHWARRFLPDKFHCFFNEQKIWSLPTFMGSVKFSDFFGRQRRNGNSMQHAKLVFHCFSWCANWHILEILSDLTKTAMWNFLAK